MVEIKVGKLLVEPPRLPEPRICPTNRRSEVRNCRGGLWRLWPPLFRWI